MIRTHLIVGKTLLDTSVENQLKKLNNTMLSLLRISGTLSLVKFHSQNTSLAESLVKIINKPNAGVRGIIPVKSNDIQRMWTNYAKKYYSLKMYTLLFLLLAK
ncbi:hypothetical protein RND71_033190 [Anisodus tanguticus]|uniref:Uncharacterized protein n=1 Tax=Anisodus tanguticus TaxID=243964 RepID=A0AAE1R8U3_9SOLA|nr:hypothetical protein RND71_033190 [Anisodus tanguticus]